ncbi:polr1d [Pungitius sinensis]
MAEENELEKRAVEELLKETDRARVRAETMGPAGWLKCPLRSTNKRFLLNTLRSTGLQQQTAESTDVNSTARGRLRSHSPDRSRNRSRTPPRDPGGKGGHADRKHRRGDSGNNKDKKPERDKERSCRHGDSRDGRRGKDGRDRAKGGLHE